ncbi:MAG: phosphoenolpyruvate carboxykinase (ATP), partial [Chitinophagaceae bacterium]|nr:phosphoenolpyruvate carboxykinase (ATP) [Chitinophagaceae bacterium]
MSIVTAAIRTPDLSITGISNTALIHYQYSPEDLVMEAIGRGEGVLNDTGALVISTGEFTGRSPKDKFIVKDELTADTVNWNEFNIPISADHFDIIYKKIITYLNERPEVWVRDCYACAMPLYRMNLRVINEKPWNNLFAYNMFLRPGEEELEHFEPEWHVISAPGLKLDPKECGTRQY